ncbi:hypothetical protein K461DRAFT_302307 [Myriangium duriaei CBS 260.36]|uniref:Uncharacterized protein n=1 Tax=Myriangium duriaei CBS 260.36 TaxID=1168546 RepID=A0A9P4IUA4_9PEZI|nr:hypothetical protein K461DRAFT_302307 [Myriangium duriaei CBS 260.36]
MPYIPSPCPTKDMPTLEEVAVANNADMVGYKKIINAWRLYHWDQWRAARQRKDRLNSDIEFSQHQDCVRMRECIKWREQELKEVLVNQQILRPQRVLSGRVVKKRPAPAPSEGSTRFIRRPFSLGIPTMQPMQSTPPSDCELGNGVYSHNGVSLNLDSYPEVISSWLSYQHASDTFRQSKQSGELSEDKLVSHSTLNGNPATASNI